MGESSAIEWTDHTFNIAWGCTKVSPGCKHCYAEGTATWRGHDVWGPDKPRRILSDAYWREPLKWNKTASHLRVMARVFCSSMADVFEDHPTLEAQRARLWPLIGETPWLQWLLLTKRPENVARMVPPSWLTWPANVLPGFTAEDQEWFDRRHGAATRSLLPTPWFVSYEPALGPIDFGAMFGISWLIMGGESGQRARARPMMLSWVRSARDQATRLEVPFFLAQKLEDGRKVSLPMLDGRQWAEMPATVQP